MVFTGVQAPHMVFTGVNALVIAGDGPDFLSLSECGVLEYLLHSNGCTLGAWSEDVDVVVCQHPLSLRQLREKGCLVETYAKPPIFVKPSWVHDCVNFMQFISPMPRHTHVMPQVTATVAEADKKKQEPPVQVNVTLTIISHSQSATHHHKPLTFERISRQKTRNSTFFLLKGEWGRI